MNDDALEFLTGGGAPTVSFPEVGAKVVGQVLKYELTQQRDFATKQPKMWDDGSPMMQVVVTLQAEEFTPEDEDDTGQRRLFVKGNMRDAVREAIRASGHKGSLVGGRLGVVFTGTGEARSGLNPPKLYRAKFEAPSADAMLDEAADPEYADGEEPF